MPRNFSRSPSKSTPQRPQQHAAPQQQHAAPQQQRAAPQQQAPPQQMPMQQPQHMPMQQPQQPSMMGSLASTMVTGVALGAGSEVGRQAVRSFMGGSSGSSEEAPKKEQPQQVQQQPQHIQQQQFNPNDKCFDFNTRFNDCMKFNSNNSNICQQSYDDLRSCQNPMI